MDELGDRAIVAGFVLLFCALAAVFIYYWKQ